MLLKIISSSKFTTLKWFFPIYWRLYIKKHQLRIFIEALYHIFCVLYWLILRPTLEYNPTKFNLVNFIAFCLLKYWKNGQILIKTHLNLNWAPFKKLFLKKRTPGFNMSRYSILSKINPYHNDPYCLWWQDGLTSSLKYWYY